MECYIVAYVAAYYKRYDVTVTDINDAYRFTWFAAAQTVAQSSNGRVLKCKVFEGIIYFAQEV